MPQAIHISPIDNVVVALHPIAKGTLVEVDGLAVTALEDIPQGHKMAVKPIKNGENVIKYGFPIGHATADAEPGTPTARTAAPPARVGDLAVLFGDPGKGAPLADEWAAKAGTINYEVVSRLGERIPRTHLSAARTRPDTGDDSAGAPLDDAAANDDPSKETPR